MVLISLILFANLGWSQNLEKFLTKYTANNLRYISNNGKTVYVQKKPGVLSVINGYNSNDFLVEKEKSDFLVFTSHFKNRVAIESIPNVHTEFNPLKDHIIYASNFGSSSVKLIGSGREARLHLNDEWISYYNSYEKKLILKNIITDKEFQFSLSNKMNPFFVPENSLITSSHFLYTDINENGIAVLVSQNLSSNIKTILYQSIQPGTRLELCSNKDYLAFGEFPYDGLDRSSKIMMIKITSETNLAGYETIYNSTSHDLGNIACTKDSIYFIKATKENEKLKIKSTDIFKINITNQNVEQISNIGNINQIIEMDEKILVPFRGDFLIAHGQNNLVKDELKKSTPENSEESSSDE